MMTEGSYIAEAMTFLIETVFELYILAVMLRFLLQLFRADFYNPISQFLIKITTPVLRPLRRWIPGFAGIDVAALALMAILKFIEIVLIAAVNGYIPGIGGLLIVSIASLLQLLIYVFIVAILIQVVLSWIAPDTYNPMTSILRSLCGPLLRPVRHRLPSLGGLDLSPLVVLIVLQLILILFVAPLADWGRNLL
jgi:YggT family protein